MSSEKPEMEAVHTFIGLCLKKLIDLGRVNRERFNVFWYAEFADEKLGKKGLTGAATLDDLERPVMYLSPRLSLEGLLDVIAHESVHLMQICKGDLYPGFGFTVWKGREYKSLAADHPDYKKQPWEKEAFELQPILLDYLKYALQIDN